MLNSLRKNKVGIFLMLLSSVFVCVGQLFWKISATNGPIFILSGFILYGFGAITMLVAYRFGSLSVLQPMLSMNYVLTVLLATTILKESFTFTKLAGITIIIAGVFLIGGGDD